MCSTGLLTLDFVCTQMTLSWLSLTDDQQVECGFEVLRALSRFGIQYVPPCLGMPFSIEGPIAVMRTHLYFMDDKNLQSCHNSQGNVQRTST